MPRIKAEHSCLFAVVFRRLWLRLRRAVIFAISLFKIRLCVLL
jgi:hypothetical protein